jgi:hypothetical protein
VLPHKALATLYIAATNTSASCYRFVSTLPPLVGQLTDFCNVRFFKFRTGLAALLFFFFFLTERRRRRRSEKEEDKERSDTTGTFA